MNRNPEAENLFKKLDAELLENIDAQYFLETRDFRSLIEVLEVLGQKVDQINRVDSASGDDLLAVLKDRNPAYHKLLNQRKTVEKVIEDVVKFQHGGLNNSVETMSEVVREYSRGREDIQGLRRSLFETQSVLTAKKVGQVPLKELWLKKVELQETLRMVRELEYLKSTPHKVQRLMQQKRYLSAVQNLTKAISTMFGEDLVAVQALIAVREQLMDLKETLLETCVRELKIAVVGLGSDFSMKDCMSGSDSEEEDRPETDSVSVSNYSNVTSSHYNSYNQNEETRSVLSKRSSRKGALPVRPAVVEPSNYSLDLREIDESLEASLVDPSATGSLFIRLLVRAIGVMECEQDVERMVLDGLSKTFKHIGVLKLRMTAVDLLKKAAARDITNPVSIKKSMRPKGDKVHEGRPSNSNSRLFTSFMSSLLDSSFLTFKRALYLMKLMYISTMQRVSSSSLDPSASSGSTIHNTIDNNKHLSEYHKRQLISVWLDMENIVTQQMLIHFVEPEVQDISDSNDASLDRIQSRSGGFELLEKEVDEDECIGDDVVDLGLEGELLPIKSLIFVPSASHAAPVYRLVLNHSLQSAKVMAEYKLEDMLTSMQASRHPPSPSSDVGRPSILAAVQLFLERELIPVIQSTVNHGMREIQLNSQHFSVADNDSNRLNSSSDKDLKKGPSAEVVRLCRASDICFHSMKPLFSYWLQLNQHRLMVSTVLERLIRGFASAAREEFENLTYNLTAIKQSSIHTSVMNSLKMDLVFKSYRGSVYAPNRVTAEDLFSSLQTSPFPSTSSQPGSAGVSVSTISAGKSNSRRSSRPVADGDLDGTREPAASEQDTWSELDYWDVGSKAYPLTSQQITKDFQSLGTIASITCSCDWLVHQLHGFCTTACRKLHRSTHHVVDSHQPSGASKMKAVAKKSDDGDARLLLVNSVASSARELSKLSEAGLGVLRAELQLICFHYLHRLAHVSYALHLRDGSTSRVVKAVQVSKHELQRQAEDAGVAEEESILDAMNDHIHQYLKAVATAAPPELLAILLSPLCAIVPLIMTRIAMHMAEAGDNPDSEGEDDIASRATTSHRLKTRLLRLVVSVQHANAVHMQSFAIPPETRRKLLDSLTEGFERSRRFVTMFDMPSDELKNYLKSHIGEFSREETETLWLRSYGRESTFAQLWNELATVPRTGPRYSSKAN